jgi:hypothetical protein
MIAVRLSNFNEAVDAARAQLLYSGERVDTGRWQGVPTEGKPDLVTQEVLNLSLEVPVARRVPHPQLIDYLADEIRPNLPWADEHFEERVGGVPMNPDPSHERWPWWKGQDDSTKKGGKFSHTYSERFWPKQAGDMPDKKMWVHPIKGLRYTYGDLNDLLDLMLREPHGRQAFLPIFFPEDTGAVHGGRIPCTLGYWFVLRDGKLNMTYYIRSCDYVRHFRDDIYLAVRLQLWVLQQVQQLALAHADHGEYEPWLDVTPGTFTMHIGSLHFHEGDRHHV